MAHGPEVTVHPEKNPIQSIFSPSLRFMPATSPSPNHVGPDIYGVTLLIIIDMQQIAVLSGHLVQYQQKTYHKRTRKLSDRHRGSRTHKRHYHNMRYLPTGTSSRSMGAMAHFQTPCDPGFPYFREYLLNVFLRDFLGSFTFARHGNNNQKQNMIMPFIRARQ